MRGIVCVDCVQKCVFAALMTDWYERATLHRNSGCALGLLTDCAELEDRRLGVGLRVVLTAGSLAALSCREHQR